VLFNSKLPTYCRFTYSRRGFLLYNSPLHSHTDDNVPDTNVTICCAWVGSNFYIQPNISKEIKFQKLFPFFSIILQFFRCADVGRECCSWEKWVLIWILSGLYESVKVPVWILSCSRAGWSKQMRYKVMPDFVEENDACSYSPFL
jgi:hypothetical protein